MSWTDERVELLKKLWAEGKSASTIAKELGSVTRNAVIGKVHRLNLGHRNGPEAEAEAGIEVQPAVADVALAAEQEPAPVPEADLGPAAEPEAPPVAVPPRDAAPAGGTVVPMPNRRPVLVPGQPLPPQPSANEISPEALANQREVEKVARKLSLMELTERTCKWPIGDPATDNFYFCGLPVVPGKPYCEAHVAVAFQPMQSRRDRRR
jgi:GcrA cell cycle regulator